MILFRTECGARQGWGHVVRSLAIADEVRALGGATAFQVAGDTAQAGVLLAGRHPLVSAPPDLAAGAIRSGARTVLLDGYGFTDADEAALAAGHLAVAVMDDFGHNPHRHAHLIVNGNLHYGHPDLYPQARAAQLLLGAAFAPLRPGLREHRSAPRVARRSVERILVVMGGSDAAGQLDAVLDVLAGCTAPEVQLVVAAPPRSPGDGAWAAHAARIAWVREPQVLAAEMGCCDLAVSAGGLTSYELAFMGVPAILLPATEMQAPVSAQLARNGCAVLLDAALPLAAALPALVHRLALDREERAAMIRAGQALFDGEGALRIAAALLALAPEAAA